MATSYNVTGLFAGIGGLELGLERAGHSTTLFCEADPEAASVLARRFPSVPRNYDVRETRALVEQIAKSSDLLTAGFPCTDLSQAGSTAGFEGKQSSLVRKVFDLLDARCFPNVLFENVPNWRFLHRGRYFTEVIEALEARGYRWAYRVIDARAFGLPQRRLRIFLFASLERDPRAVLMDGDVLEPSTKIPLREAAHGFYWTEGTRGLGWGEDCVPTLKGGSAIGIPAAPAVLLPDGLIITPSLRDGERLQGFNAGWTDLDVTAPEFGERRFNQRRRWLLIGNAVNVRVSTWIGNNLRALDGAAAEKHPEEPIKTGDRWPAAAWGDGRSRWRVAAGTWPVANASEPLAEFLHDDGQPLSVRATKGFYSRLSKSQLRVSPEFKSAVAAHLTRMESGCAVTRMAAE